jgi:CheY-like chemotaxis protein
MNKKRILIVDDEPAITRQLKLQLEHTGRYIVHAENDGAAALRAAPAFKPDLALLDFLMPGLDGGDVKNGLHEILGLNSLPVIFLSAIAAPDDHNDKDVFISKPASVNVIIDLMEQQLNHAASAQQISPP